MSNNKLNPMLSNMMPIVDTIGDMFGPNCEVVLHDLSKPKSSIIKIVNSHVSGRKIGDSLRDLIFTVLRSKKFDDNRLVNYMTKTKDGKTLKSSTVVLRDEDGELIGALCINYDISDLLIVDKRLKELKAFCETNELSEIYNIPEYIEKDEITKDVNNILKQIINSAIEESGKSVSKMNKDEKVELVRFFNEKGVFLIKGAVDYVAQELNVSRYTVYNYLQEIKGNDIV
jgi:predicted transcriptional regulator YheO